MREDAISSGGHSAVPLACTGLAAPAANPLLFEREPSHAMRTLRRARAALGGFDEHGRHIGPSMFDPDVVSFAHGEGVRRPYPAVIAAGVHALLDSTRSSLDNYLFLQRMEALDAAITQQFCRLGVPADIACNVVLDAGVSRIFSALLQIGTTPGDLLLTHPGFYHPLAQWCHDARLQLECVPCERAQGFKLNAQSLSDWADRRLASGGRLPTVLAVFNPSMAGAVYSQQELDEIAAVIARWDTWVVEDCIFADTEFEERRYGKLAACAAIQERVVTLCGASKAYALANVRAGWACATGDVARRLQAHIVGHAATLPQIMKFMALAALNAPRQYLEVNTGEVRARVELIGQLLQSLNAELPPRADGSPWIDVALQPQAGHSLLLDFGPVLQALQRSGCAMTDSIDLVRWLLGTVKLAFSPGASNGWTGGLVRCVHGCVGAEFTYEGSAELERLAAWRAVDELARVGAAAGLPGAREARAWIDDWGADVPGLAERACQRGQAGFLAGRARIRHAFLDRLLPGLRLALRGTALTHRVLLN